MVKDEEVSSALGTMAGIDSTLIANGAGNEIKGNDNAGAKIDAGNTLTFNNIKTLTDLKMTCLQQTKEQLTCLMLL